MNYEAKREKQKTLVYIYGKIKDLQERKDKLYQEYLKEKDDMTKKQVLMSLVNDYQSKISLLQELLKDLIDEQHWTYNEHYLAKLDCFDNDEAMKLIVGKN